jgi:copper oxidase (laccase) domain-containing protein
VPFYKTGSIKFYKFKSFENQGLYHAVFTRHGGFSPSPWHSLNFGASVGDNLHRVKQNREIALKSINLRPDNVFDLYQVHSTEIVTTNRPLYPNEPHQKADAILTNQPEVILMMRFADCVPILLFDPVNRAIGIVHAGWIGTADQISKFTVLRMVSVFGTNPSNIMDRIHTSIGDKAEQCILYKDGKTYLDLWKTNKIILNDVGVNNIEVSGICTFCNLDDWYSHRGENGKTGRFGVVFGLQ